MKKKLLALILPVLEFAQPVSGWNHKLLYGNDGSWIIRRINCRRR